MLSPTQGAANIAKIAGMNALSGLAGGETYERTGNGNAALLASILRQSLLALFLLSRPRPECA